MAQDTVVLPMPVSVPVTRKQRSNKMGPAEIDGPHSISSLERGEGLS